MNNRATNQYTICDNSVSPIIGEKWHDIIFVDGSGGACEFDLPLEDEINIKNGHTITFMEKRGTIDQTNTFKISLSPNNYPIIDQLSLVFYYSPFTFSLTYMNQLWWPTNLLTTTRMVDLQIHDTSGAGPLSIGINRFPVVIPKEYHNWFIENISYTLAQAGSGIGTNDVRININGTSPVLASAASMAAGVTTAEATAIRQQVRQYDRIFTEVTGITAIAGQGLFGVLTLSQV